MSSWHHSAEEWLVPVIFMFSIRNNNPHRSYLGMWKTFCVVIVTERHHWLSKDLMCTKIYNDGYCVPISSRLKHSPWARGTFRRLRKQTKPAGFRKLLKVTRVTRPSYANSVNCLREESLWPAGPPAIWTVFLRCTFMDYLARMGILMMHLLLSNPSSSK